MQQLQISAMNEPESLESTRIKFGRAQLRGLFLVLFECHIFVTFTFQVMQRSIQNIFSEL